MIEKLTKKEGLDFQQFYNKTAGKNPFVQRGNRVKWGQMKLST